MAKIPVYTRQNLGSDTIQAPRQSANAPAAAFGGQLGRTLQQAGGALQDGGDKMTRIMVAHQKKVQQEKWEADADAAFTEFSLATDRRLYEDEDAYFNRQVGFADGSTQDFLDDYEKRRNAATKNMGPEVARRFDAKINAAKRSNAKLVARHEAAEIKKHRANSAESAGLASVRSITAAWSDDPANIELRFQDEARDKLSEAAQLRGHNVNEVLTKTKDAMYGQIIEQHIAVGATEKAKALAQRWDEDLSPERRESITKAVHRKELLVEGDNRAEGYYAALKDGHMTPSQIEDDMAKIEDADVKRMTRAAFRPLASAWKLDQQELTVNMQNKAVEDLGGMAGDFKAQYDHIQTMPERTKPEKAAKATAQKVYNRNIKTKGINPITDPAVFDETTNKIIHGEITDEQALRTHAAEQGMVKADADFLVRQLKSSQTLKGLRAAYLTASGTSGSSVPKAKGQDYRDFMVWAEKQAKDTNRAMEPDYVQKLADMWHLQGESPTDDTFHFGYGQDMPFSKAANDPNWLPDIVDDGTAGEMNLTESRAKVLIDALPATAREAWLKAAGGDKNIAARMYWKKYLQETHLGKKTRQGAQ